DGKRNQPVDTIVVQVAAETLKLRRQQHRVSLVDLLRQITPPRSPAADGAVGVFDFVQEGGTPYRPVLQRERRHPGPPDGWLSAPRPILAPGRAAVNTERRARRADGVAPRQPRVGGERFVLSRAGPRCYYWRAFPDPFPK